jgi:hypothetical protein
MVDCGLHELLADVLIFAVCWRQVNTNANAQKNMLDSVSTGARMNFCAPAAVNPASVGT